MSMYTLLVESELLLALLYVRLHCRIAWLDIWSYLPAISTLLCQQALGDILTFLQETQKRDFKCFSLLSSFAKINNNFTAYYQYTRLRSFYNIILQQVIISDSDWDN